MPDVLVSLDLGKRSDPTALAVLYRALRLAPSGLPERGPKGGHLYRYRCPTLNQYPLGTDYTAIVQDVAGMLEGPAFPNPTYLVLDATGVGTAVVEMFRNARIPKARIVPVTITAGSSFRRDSFAAGLSGWWVAKSELASHLQAALQGGHLKVDKGIPFATMLKKELQNFQVKVTKAANETFSAREGDHDDLVLALAQGIWVGNNRGTAYLNNAPVGMSPKETALLELETQHEAEALGREKTDRERKAQNDWNNPMSDHWY